MQTWAKGVFAVTVFTEELEETSRFYRDVFGYAPTFEDDDSAAFDFGNVLINVLAVRAAPELINPAKVATPDAGSRVQITLGVDDVDAVCAVLADRGVELVNGPMDRPWGPRTACFRDPGGHLWEIAS